MIADIISTVDIELGLFVITALAVNHYWLANLPHAAERPIRHTN